MYTGEETNLHIAPPVRRALRGKQSLREIETSEEGNVWLVNVRDGHAGDTRRYTNSQSVGKLIDEICIGKTRAGLEEAESGEEGGRR